MNATLSSEARLLYDLPLPPFFRQYGTCLEGMLHFNPAEVQGGGDKTQHGAAQRRLFITHCKTGALDDVVAMFVHISHQHILVWNALMQAHSSRGYHCKILGSFNQMLQEGIMPNKVTFACVLSACTALLRLPEGMQLHACINYSKFKSNVIVKTALIVMHGKCGSMEDALLLFESLIDRDVVVFNAMMRCLLKHEAEREVFQLFKQMLQGGVIPSRVTYITLVEACNVLGDGDLVYCCIVSSQEYQADVSLGNAFIHMYGRCNHPAKAQQFFFHMQKWDAISWNTLMGVFCKQEELDKVLEILVLMQKKGFLADEYTYITLLSSCASAEAFYEGMCVHACAVCSHVESNVGVSTALLSMYGRCGNVADALGVFHVLGAKTLVSWNAIIALCTQQGNYEDAIRLFYEMIGDGIQPDKVTFVHMMSSCTNAGGFSKGRSACLLACKLGYEMDPVVGSSLVSMHCTCGKLEEANIMFSQISNPSVWSWNMVLKAHACHGNGEGMFELLNQLQKGGCVPDDVTFVAVMSGCDHLGYISKGLILFKLMQEMYNIVPGVAHYVCLIDLLGRAGQLEEAACIVDMIPLLSCDACRTALASAYHSHLARNKCTTHSCCFA